MNLNEYLNTLDGRKKVLTLYKAYAISVGGQCSDPLPLNLDKDVFALTPEMAFQLTSVTNPEVFDKFREILEQSLVNTVAGLKEWCEDFFTAFKKPQVIQDKDDPETFNVEPTDSHWYVAISSFTIPMEMVRDRPAIYDMEGNPIVDDHPNKDLINFTLRDREFKMSCATYEVKKYSISYKTKKDKTTVKISGVKLEEVPQGVKPIDLPEPDTGVEE